MKKTLNYLLFLLAISVAGCDMPLSDDFEQHITYEENVPISIVFNTNWENGTMMLTGKDAFVIPYSISALDKNIIEIEMNLGNKKWEYCQPNGELVIYRDEMNDGNYTLTCNVIIKSGTGSLADQINNEFYGASFSLPVQVNRSLETPKRIRQYVSTDGFLALEWDKPEVGHLELIDYSLYYSGPGYFNTETIAASENRYIDDKYAGEERYYQLTANLKDRYTNQIVTWIIDSYSMDNNIDISYKKMDNGRVIVEWLNPYPHQVKINGMNDLIDIDLKSNNLSFSIPPLKDNCWDDIQTISLEFSNTINPETPFYNHTIDIPLYADNVTDGKFANFYYNRTDNKVYAITQNELIAINPDNYQSVKEKDLNTYYAGEMCTSPNSSLVVAYVANVNNQNNNDYLIAYRNSDMEELWRVPCLDKRYNGTGKEQLFLTTDNKLIYFSERSSQIYAIVMNVFTGAREKEIRLDADSYIYEMAISPDGKKICYSESFATYIYDLDNYEVKGKHTLFADDYLKRCFFMVDRPNEMATTCNSNNDVTYWDLTTREKIRIISPINSSSLLTIDQYTGNLLLKNNRKMYVASDNDGSILFETNSITNSCSLVNNHLNSYDGMLLNLNNYMAK